MRILFLRLGAIGDVVQCAMAIAIFKKANPHTKVDWAVSDSLASFVKALGVADGIIPINYEGLINGSLFSRLKTFIQEALKLKRLSTVNFHVMSFKRKLEANGRNQAVIKAIKLGLLS